MTSQSFLNVAMCCGATTNNGYLSTIVRLTSQEFEVSVFNEAFVKLGLKAYDRSRSDYLNGRT